MLFSQRLQPSHEERQKGNSRSHCFEHLQRERQWHYKNEHRSALFYERTRELYYFSLSLSLSHVTGRMNITTRTRWTVVELLIEEKELYVRGQSVRLIIVHNYSAILHALALSLSLFHFRLSLISLLAIERRKQEGKISLFPLCIFAPLHSRAHNCTLAVVFLGPISTHWI